MPNWIEGTIKLRGTSEDIRKFLEEKINYYDFKTWIETGEDTIVPREKWKFKIEDWGDCFEVSWDGNAEPYIEGSRRAFLTSSQAYFENNQTSIVCFDIKQAWAFTPDDTEAERWENLSKETNLDIRLFGFECGMQFGQEIEIINGKVTINKYFSYNDYNWECPFPNMGG